MKVRTYIGQSDLKTTQSSSDSKGVRVLCFASALEDLSLYRARVYQDKWQASVSARKMSSA